MPKIVKISKYHSKRYGIKKNPTSLFFFFNLQEIGFDVKKNPLGKIKKSQILKAYKILKDITKIIDGDDVSDTEADIGDLTNRFYTLLPHDFGMSRPPMIDTKVKVSKKIELGISPKVFTFPIFFSVFSFTLPVPRQ